MNPKILKTGAGSFSRAPFVGHNTAGFVPMSDKILILPDTVDAATEGGVQLPDEIRDRMDLSAESGVVAAMGPEAFQLAANGTPWVGMKPQVGSHVYFERFAGQVLHGRDGKVYRVMDARCIGALALEAA